MDSRLPALRSFLGGLRTRLSPLALRNQLQSRASQLLDKARALGVSDRTPAGLLDPARARELFDRVREGKLPEDMERVGTQVQRLGQRAFARMLKRWPALADLVSEPAQVIRRRRQRQSSPHATPVTRAGARDDTALEVLVVQLVAASTWQNRASAAAALAHLPGEVVVEALRRALRDTSAEVAIAAVDALSQRSEPAAVDALRSVVDNGDGFFSPVTRVATLSALGGMLSESELAPVVACLRDVDAEVSIAAIAVLADRKRRAAAEHLLPILEDSSGYFLPLVRLAAANALTQTGALTPDLAVQLLDREQAQAVRRVLERAAQIASPP